MDMTQQENLFSFMNDVNKELMEVGEFIDQHLFTDPHSVLVKARLFAETLTKIVMKNEDLEEVYDIKQVERVHKLNREGIMTDEIHDKFELIRKVGNKAVHEPQFGSVEAALKIHKFVYDISVWYMELYGDVTFKAPKYRIPKVKSQSAIDKKELEDIISRSVEETIGTTLDEKLKLLQEQLLKVQELTRKQDPVEKEPPTKNTNPLFNQEPFPVQKYLISEGFEVVDKRKNGGALWIIGGWELKEKLEVMKEKKIYFKYTKKGSRSTKNKPGWFMLGKYNKDLGGANS